MPAKLRKLAVLPTPVRPEAQLYMIEGWSIEQKEAVIRKVTQAPVEAVGVPKETVLEWIREMPKEN